MAVRSNRLGGPVNVVGGVNTTMFTVEAGETWIVKRVTLYNAGALPAILTLGVNGNTAGVILALYAVPAGESLDREVWWVLRAGEALRAATVAGSNVTVSCHGAELEGVAD